MNSNGTPNDLISQLQKMLEEKEIELKKYRSENNELSEKVSYLANILALMPGNVFWKDKSGKFLGCNNVTSKIHGFKSNDEIIGKYTHEFIDYGDEFSLERCRQIDEIDRNIMASGEGIYYEEEGYDIDKEPAIYLTQKIPLYDKNNLVTGILGVSFDITERKKMEEELRVAKEKAQASNRAKSDFLAVINHELRTPLTSMIGLVDILKKDKLTEDQEKAIIHNLENCTEILLGLVNDILDFSKLKSGKQSLHNESVNLRDLLNDVLGILTVLAKRKNLALVANTDADIPQWIITDPRVMRHILINLINNAIKFTDAGTISIHIQKCKEASLSPMHVKLEITITDSGQGISPENLDKIFEPFQQVEDIYVRRSSQSGTGLGLTIVKRLADLIETEIRVTSEIGKGSVFSLIGHFQLGEAPVENTSSKIEPIEVPQSREKLKILLIEDDQIIQFIHKKMLIELDCTVDIASNGLEALKILNHHDIIFVDLSLPDITGFEIIKLIRERQEAEKKYFVVALTAYTTQEQEIACINAGADEFATKPISQIQLKNLLDRHLKMKS